MNGSTLEALRRLLFFSRPEAATLIGASLARPRGVSDRAWRMFEAGDLPVPDDIAERMGELMHWRDRALATAESQIRELRARLPRNAAADIRLCWYDSIDDWATLPGREPIQFRPQQSVLAELAARHGAALVRFDAPAYAAWLGKREDNEGARGAWAARDDTDGLGGTHHP